jgi:hypothetical protein
MVLHYFTASEAKSILNFKVTANLIFFIGYFNFLILYLDDLFEVGYVHDHSSLFVNWNKKIICVTVPVEDV